MNELTQELQYQNYNQRQLNDVFIDACKNGYLETVKYLLTSSELKENADIHANDDYGFKLACINGHLETVKYLLTSPDLVDHADIHAGNDYGLQWACRGKHLDVVKYLLTSPGFTEQTNLHIPKNNAFLWACTNGYLDVVRYLLTSPDLVEHADIHVNNDVGFQSACSNGHLEIVQYLLSFNGEQCIEFQKTDYHLEWAINHQYNHIIIAMMKSLKNNNPYEYLECLPKIKIYNKELHTQIKSLEMDDIAINSSVPELFM